LLGDLTRTEWLDNLDLTADDLPEVLILRGTRNLRYYYDKYKMHFDDVVEVGSPNAVFEDLLIGKRHGHTMAYASVYGAPMSAEIVHLCGVLGCKAVILTGCCGALDSTLQAGDLVCAINAYRGEGASQYYLRNLASEQRGEWAPADEGLTGHLSQATTAEEISLRLGPIYTTSALFAERVADIRAWRDMGCVAADMETATVLTVAQAFGMAAASLLFVFDSPGDGSHILLEEGDKSERRALGESEMIRLALDLAAAIATDTEPS